MRVTVVLAATLLLVARVSFAEPVPAPAPGAQPQPQQVETIEWYGWQVFAADAASSALFVVSANNNLDYGAYASVVTLGLAAPMIHLAHHRPGAAAASLALRIAVPLIAIAVGQSSSCSTHAEEFCALGAAAAAFLAGYVVVEAIDILGLSWETKRVRPA